MAKKRPRVLYLIGAGATHAEKQLELVIKKASKITASKDGGLLAKHVSERVIERLFGLKTGRRILDKYHITKASLSGVPPPKPWIDIELFISLIEANKTEDTENEARILRKYFKEDILKNLSVTVDKQILPRLCPALIEWHQHDNSEQIIGFLSLNYDSIFERSLKLNKKNFDYGLSVEKRGVPWPYKRDAEWQFLKLHGSFDWYLSPDVDKVQVKNDGATEKMLWIPPRLNKEYLNYPYNILHGKAYELLTQCDILRVVGCALSQNDIGLISLLFKTQHNGSTPFRIDVVGSSSGAEELVTRLGMFLTFEESFYQRDDFQKLGKDPTENYLLDWLYYKVKNSKIKNLDQTKYLRRIEGWHDHE